MSEGQEAADSEVAVLSDGSGVVLECDGAGCRGYGGGRDELTVDPSFVVAGADEAAQGVPFAGFGAPIESEFEVVVGLFGDEVLENAGIADGGEGAIGERPAFVD